MAASIPPKKKAPTSKEDQARVLVEVWNSITDGGKSLALPCSLAPFSSHENANPDTVKKVEVMRPGTHLPRVPIATLMHIERCGVWLAGLIGSAADR
jgi:hypothetical protein